jgi:SpoVK/Ycf46/Vps4 family AAA+-type ATPase
MPTIDQLSKLFKALASKDLPTAEHVAHEIASDEEEKGHRTAAQLLKGSLVSNGTRSLSALDGHINGNGIASLLTGALSRRNSTVRLGDVVLRPDARRRLEDLTREFRGQARLKSLGIRRRSKLILHGPPGCGKSLTAQALANELRVPMYIVRFDSVIGAYLGQTATHLRQLFQFAESTQCVLLFDEIDALGKRRGNPTDVGELDRIVIALMQELELSDLLGFVIATSNMPDSLDEALWRRFDLAINFPAPNKREIARFVRAKADSFGLPVTKRLLGSVAGIGNYAEIERAIENEARRVALSQP